ncbi:MAG: AEC family transporter [Clostridia bacterium]|nr:AEC family transporter [Clostridia bacterium]
MNFFTVFNQVLALFLMMVVGYAAKKMNIFSDASLKDLSSILLNLTLPAMIISSMQREYTSQLMVQGLQILLISLATYGFSFLIAWIMPGILKPSPREKGVFQFMLMFTNVGFMGYPVLNAIFGEQSLFYAAIYNLPFNLLAFTVGIMMLTKKDDSSSMRFSPKIFLNPGVISVIIGTILFVFSVKLPQVLYGTLDMLGSMTTPLSMIIIGAILSGMEFKKLWNNWRMYIICIFRLLVIPIIIYFALKPFITKEPLMLAVPVVINAMPVATLTTILAEQYSDTEDIASQGVFLSTLFSVITIPLIAIIFA